MQLLTSGFLLNNNRNFAAMAKLTVKDIKGLFGFWAFLLRISGISLVKLNLLNKFYSKSTLEYALFIEKLIISYSLKLLGIKRTNNMSVMAINYLDRNNNPGKGFIKLRYNNTSGLKFRHLFSREF